MYEESLLDKDQFKEYKRDEKIKAIKSEVSDISVQPGFMDKLETAVNKGMNFTDPDMDEYLSLNDFSTFTRDTKTTWSEETYGLMTGTRDMQDAIKMGFLENIKNRILGNKLIDTIEEKRYLPLFEIHRPKLKGCKSSLEISTSIEKQKQFLLKILGFGGGPTFSCKYGIYNEIVSENDCLKFFIPVKIQHKIYKNTYSDKNEYFSRSGVIEVLKGNEIRNIPSNKDKCNLPISMSELFSPNITIHKFNYKNATGQFTNGFHKEIGDNICIDLGFSLPIPGISDSLKISFKRDITVMNRIEFKYKLTGNNNYQGYEDQRKFGLWWTW